METIRKGKIWQGRMSPIHYLQYWQSQIVTYNLRVVFKTNLYVTQVCLYLTGNPSSNQLLLPVNQALSTDSKPKSSLAKMVTGLPPYVCPEAMLASDVVGFPRALPPLGNSTESLAKIAAGHVVVWWST